MSIDDVTAVSPRVQYVAAAAQTVFDYPFQIFAATDIIVDVDGTTKANAQDYTVDVDGSNVFTGTLTFVDAMAGGEIVTIYRSTTLERLVDYQSNGPLASSALNDDLDKLTVISQELDAAIKRCLRLPITADVADADIELLPANYAGKYLSFDNKGKPTPAALSSTTMTQAIIGGLLFPQNAAETAASVTPTASYEHYGRGKRYGIAADGVTDDRTALVAAIAQANQNGEPVLLPAGTILVGSSFTIPANVVIRGAGRNRTTIKRGFTGDFITSAGAYHVLEDLTIEGDTATRGAGRGILMPATTPGAIHSRIVVKNFVESCLEFAGDGGSTFRAVGCNYETTGAVLSVGAVKVAGTDSAATSRHFIGCESSGCTLYDFGNCDDLYVIGGYTGGVIFGTGASKVLMSSVRIAGTGPSTIKGGSHRFPGCVFAYTPVVDASGANVDLTGAECAGNTVTNSGSSTRYFGYTSYTPTLTADTTAPTIGNGTMNGLAHRKWNAAQAVINITWGSTSTFGSGQWYFSLPYPDVSSYKYIGRAFMKDASTGFVYEGLACSIAGSQKVQVFMAGGTGTVLSPSTPFTWAQGDELRIQIDYDAS